MFIHLRQDKTNPRGGITIAAKQVNESTWAFATAICHPKDNFSKRLGRVKAEGRLNSPHHCRYVPNVESPDQVYDKILSCIGYKKDDPQNTALLPSP